MGTILLILLVIIILLLPMTFQALAKLEMFFVNIKTNHFVFIERGGVLDSILTDLPGKVLVKNKTGWKKSKVRDSKPNEKQKKYFSPFNKFLYSKMGIYFYGIYPFKKVKRIKIIKEREVLGEKDPKNWIQKAGLFEVSALRAVFPRPYSFMSVELKDGFTVDIKMVLKFKVVVPYIPVYELESGFFSQAGSILQSEIIDKLREVATINDFIDLAKGETEGFLSQIKKRDENDLNSEIFDFSKYSLVNQEMIRQVGICIIGISINDWSPSDEKTADLMKGVAVAKLTGDAQIAKSEKEKVAEEINATKYAHVLDIKTRADVDRESKLIDLRTKKIKQMVEKMSGNLADPNIVNEIVGKILQAEEVAKSNITTWVQESSGDSRIVVPTEATGGKKS